MTDQLLDNTDTMFADQFILSSSNPIFNGDHVIRAAAGMNKIPQQELRNFVSSQDPCSSPTMQEDIFTLTSLQSREGVLPVFHAHSFEKERERFIPLQKWEGVVLKTGLETFLARLVDLTHCNQDEEAELSVDEVSAADANLLKPGGVFYWTIGYLDDRFGQRQRASRIRFRRLPAWTVEEIAYARREADSLAIRLKWM